MVESAYPQTNTLTLNHLSRAQLHYIINRLPQYLWLHDLEGTITDVNTSWYEAEGFIKPGHLIGKKIKDVMPQKYREVYDAYIEKILNAGSSAGRISLITEEGEERVYEYNNILIYDSSGTPLAVAGFGKDITKQLKTEKKLQKSEQKYRNILETIEDGYYEVDLGGHFTFFNPAMARILGFPEEELAGMSYKQFSHPDYTNTIYETFNMVFHSREPTKAFEWKLIRKDGTECFVETSVSIIEDENEKKIGFRGILRDITERVESEKESQQLENQLFYSQKMEALGTLAGGFAHNFNNILFPLIGYIDMALMDMPAGAPNRRHLEKALESANQAKRMIHRVQEYTRNDKSRQIQSIEIPKTVNNALRMFRGSLSSRTKLSIDMDEKCPRVVADADQIQQVIVNLCANANDAIMAKDKSGNISVAVTPAEIDPANPKADNPLPPGRYARISVADSGCGIDPDLVEKIFDPFFTTKAETGKGLGLSLAHRIVKKYGGEIFVDSVKGKGTTITVYLPEKPTSDPLSATPPAD